LRAENAGFPGDFDSMKLVLIFFALTAAVISPVFGQTGDESFVPSNPPQMRRLTGFNSPAWRAAKLFMHGVNLGNYLESPPDADWGVTVSASEFYTIKHEGFDHVRIPIGWQYYVGPAPDYTISPEIFSRVDFAVTNALAAGLAVIINIHDFNELDKNPDATTDEFLRIWEQIARHYKKFPGQLAFELDNEPHANATTAVMNPIYARVIREIRRTDRHRTLFVEPGDWGSITQLKNLVLPPDNNVIVSVHSYEPFMFTHQGATWAGPMPRQTGIQFPGPPATPLMLDPSLHLPKAALDWIQRYNSLPADENPSSPKAFEGRLRYARQWSDYYGRPIHLGEFGCFTKADPASRVRLYAAYRKSLGEDKIGWAIWDWSAGFRYWDKTRDRPVPGMRDALFGN
jgi:endoglucanase